MIVAQEQLAKIAVEQQRYDSAKMRVDQAAQQPVAQQQVAQQPAVPKVDPKAEEWAKTNTWFGDDKIMTNAVLTIHQDLISEEGFDANTDEYYNELNRRMRTEFPHKFETKKRSGGEVRSHPLVPPHLAIINRGAGRLNYLIQRYL